MAVALEERAPEPYEWQSEEEAASVLTEWLFELCSGDPPLFDFNPMKFDEGSIRLAIASNESLGMLVEWLLRELESVYDLPSGALNDYYRPEETRGLFPRWALAGRLPNPRALWEHVHCRGTPASVVAEASAEAETEWRDILQETIRLGLYAPSNRNSAVSRHPPTLRIAGSFLEWNLGANGNLMVSEWRTAHLLRLAELAGGLVRPGSTFDIYSKEVDERQKRPLLHINHSRIDPNGMVVLYHVTHAHAADKMLRQGIRFGEKVRWNRTAPGQSGNGDGAGDGLYLGPVAYGLKYFGDTPLEVMVKVSDLSVPPEESIPFWRGIWTPLGCMSVGDGYTEADIPASQVGRVGEMPQHLRVAWPPKTAAGRAVASDWWDRGH